MQYTSPITSLAVSSLDFMSGFAKFTLVTIKTVVLEKTVSFVVSNVKILGKTELVSVTVEFF